MLISPLNDLVKKYQPNISVEDIAFLKEFVLWGLVQVPDPGSKVPRLVTRNHKGSFFPI